MKTSTRARGMEPFYVMEVAKAASDMAARFAQTDAPMIFLNIGEPDFTAPPLVVEAAAKALHDGRTQYTQATGLPALRERISDWYRTRFGLQVPAGRIVVTAGASAALHLACLALIERGDRILMPDPSYPCNRQFVGAAEGVAQLIHTTAAERFALTADKVAAAWTRPDHPANLGEALTARGETLTTRGETLTTRGVLLASPSNPTGTSIHPDELRRIHQVVSGHGGITLVDEIYLGLSYDDQYGHTALALDDQIISINSFSKYFNMTGWRLGWLVVPEDLVPVIERLAQNLFICPSSIAQHAALACFEADSIAEYERRRAEFKARRDYFVPALNAMGLAVPVMPDGAFYAWADCTALCQQWGLTDGWDFSFELMRRAHIAVTPGRDFGRGSTHNFVRFSTASSMAHLQEAVARLQVALA